MREPELWRGIGATLCGAAGGMAAWTGGGPAVAVAGLAWLAVAAPACGAWLAHVRPWPWRVLPPALWCAACLVSAPASIPSMIGAVGVVAALYVFGSGVGALWRRAPIALFACALFLALLPTFFGLGSAPWPPAVGAFLFDCAPTTLVLEAGRVDWMRHPAVYEALGTSSIGPDLRVAWSAPLAAGLPLVVGCLALVGAHLRLRP